MPKTLANLFKQCVVKYNEKMHCQNNDELVNGTTLIIPTTKHTDTGPIFHEEKVCEDNFTDEHSEINDDIQKSSSNDECICNGELSCPLEHSNSPDFNEEHCTAQDSNENNFGFQCRQWLDTTWEKDLFLNTAFVAQSSRRRQTIDRDNLCFQWLNTADNELFLNAAFAAKSSRRRHTR